VMAAANGVSDDPGLLSRIEVAEGVVASLARRVIALEDVGAAGARGNDTCVAAPIADGASAAADATSAPDAAAAASHKHDALLSEVLLQLADLRADMVSVANAHQAEATALAEDNAKLRYRIKHLLRALDAADGYVPVFCPVVRAMGVIHVVRSHTLTFGSLGLLQFASRCFCGARFA